MDFNEALNTFLVKCQAKLDSYYERRFTHVKAPKLEIDEGTKFVRIVSSSESSRSVFCFVAKVDSVTKGLGEVRTGDVLKSASWKAPARGRRGTIFTEDPAEYGVNEYGANYFR